MEYLLETQHSMTIYFILPHSRLYTVVDVNLRLRWLLLLFFLGSQ